MITPYDVLGIPPTATPEQAAEARDTLLRTFDPFRFVADDADYRAATHITGVINAAYRDLLDEVEARKRVRHTAAPRRVTPFPSAAGPGGAPVCEDCGVLLKNARYTRCWPCASQDMDQCECGNWKRIEFDECYYCAFGG